MKLYAVSCDGITDFVEAGSFVEAIAKWQAYATPDESSNEPDSIIVAVHLDEVIR